MVSSEDISTSREQKSWQADEWLTRLQSESWVQGLSDARMPCRESGRVRRWVDDEHIAAPASRVSASAIDVAVAEAFRTNQPFEMENHLRRFDGVYRWFNVRRHPLLDSNGRAARWYFLITDMEERKRTEEALRRSQAFLAEAQRISSTGSFSWRLDTDEIIFSEELYRIFELDENAVLTLELIGSRVHPDDTP